MGLNIDGDKIDGGVRLENADVETAKCAMMFAQAVSMKRIADELVTLRTLLTQAVAEVLPLLHPIMMVRPSEPLQDDYKGGGIDLKVAADLLNPTGYTIAGLRDALMPALGHFKLDHVVSLGDGGALNIVEWGTLTPTLLKITAEEARNGSWRTRWHRFIVARKGAGNGYDAAH
ncbi:hypothetical protein [Bradyrhizobium sp. Ai1a-2]|uniref:hypothetical protein n=1 Tax=Bradyrhizobium sp. Ai1a-2 TaxID=196490 RepID=UPI000426FE55|nr:hypothetical protein [Bradyrhizobium sp. Ai1a-2]